MILPKKQGFDKGAEQRLNKLSAISSYILFLPTPFFVHRAKAKAPKFREGTLNPYTPYHFWRVGLRLPAKLSTGQVLISLSVTMESDEISTHTRAAIYR
jgi:hypothetical protein